MTKRIIVPVLLAVVALFLAGCEVEEEVDEPEPTVAVSTPAPRLVATVPVLIPRVRANAQLEVTLADLQVGKDGRYRIADRGDGCEYEETDRTPAKVIGGLELPEEVMLWADGCEVGCSYEPTTGRLNVVVP